MLRQKRINGKQKRKSALCQTPPLGASSLSQLLGLGSFQKSLALTKSEFVKSEYQKKQEAKERAAKSLQQTKKRLGVGPARPPVSLDPRHRTEEAIEI